MKKHLMVIQITNNIPQFLRLIYNEETAFLFINNLFR